MKKLLLSLLSLVALTVNAQTEFTWTSQDWGCTVTTDADGKISWTTPDQISFSKDGLTMSSVKGDATTAPTVAANATPNDVRIYAKGVLKVGYTENITGLEFKISAAGKKRLANITASAGTVTVDAQNYVVYWVGSAKSLTLTAGDKATYGTDGATKAGQFDFESVKLYVGGAKPNVTTSDKQPSGLAYSQGSKTVTLGTEYELPTLSNPNKLTVTYSSTKPEVATIDATGKVTIVAAGTCTIKAESEENDNYFAGKASYSLTVKEAETGGGDDDTPKTEVAIPYEESFASSVGSFTIDDKSLGDGLTYVWKYNTSKYMKASAYASSKNIAAESWLISPIIDLTSATDPVLKFSECVNKYFGNAATEATVQISEASANSWTTLSIAHPTLEDGKIFSSWADQEVSIKNMAGKKIKVAFVYKSTSSAAGTWEVKKFSVAENTTSSISAVKTDANNSAIYNLAGQRVSSSYKGAVIKNGKKYIVK